MSILIKGAKIPSSCAWCYFNEDSRCVLIVGCDYDETGGAKIRTNCPLIELPEHGDLIDRDALDADIEKRYCAMGCKAYGSGVEARCNACWVRDMQDEIIEAPAVIPAERR